MKNQHEYCEILRLTRNGTPFPRFACVTNTMKIVDSIKREKFTPVINDIIDNIKDKYSVNKHYFDEKTISVLVLLSGLSLRDRDYALQEAVSGTTNVLESNVIVVEIEHYSSNCVHSLLTTIACAVVIKYPELRESTVMSLLKDFPLEALVVMTVNATGLVVVLKRSEFISSALIGELVVHLSAVSSLRTCIVAVTTEECPVPLPVDRRALSSASFSVIRTAGPKAIFDDILTSICTSDCMALQLPSAVIDSLQTTLGEFSMCISSAIDRLRNAISLQWCVTSIVLTLCTRLLMCIAIHMRKESNNVAVPVIPLPVMLLLSLI